MREYEETKEAQRRAFAEERAVYKFQQKSEKGNRIVAFHYQLNFSSSSWVGYDPLTDWKKLRDEGKIKIGKDLERDPKSARLGSEGLIEVRVDERMPYIDQGYVDESADVMGNVMKLFGGKKDDKKK